MQGGAGNDTLMDGAGSNQLFGDTGDDTLIVSGGTNSLVGGMGDDTFIVENDWGTATVHDSEDSGEDTIDFSRVTQSITHQFNDGVLVSSTGTFQSTTSYWNDNIMSTGDASGTFTGGSTLTVPLENEVNPTFSLALAGAATSGNVTLTFGTAGATGNIAYNADATVLAKNIKTAIEAKFTGLKVQVKAGTTANNFTIEVTTATDVFQESVKGLFRFVPVSASSVLGGSSGVTLGVVDNGQSLNEIQRLTLTGAPASIKIKLGDSLTAAIAIGSDDAVNAAAIKTALNALNQYGGIGGTVLATFGLKNYDVSVVVTGAKTYEVIFHAPNASNVAEMVVQNSTTSAEVANSVTTLQDGRASSSLTNIETVVAADADNRFIFGNGWGTDYKYGEQYLAEFLRSPDSDLTIDTKLATQNGHSLILDFSAVSKELKFTFSSEEYSRQQLDFSTSTGTVDLVYTDSDVYEIDLGTATSGQFKLNMMLPDGTTPATTESITVKGTAAATAYNIGYAIKKALPGVFSQFGDNVRVTFDDKAPGKYKIAFLDKGYEAALALNTGSGTNTVTGLTATDVDKIASAKNTVTITINADDAVTAASIQTELNKFKYSSGENLDVRVTTGTAKTWTIIFDQADSDSEKIQALKVFNTGTTTAHSTAKVNVLDAEEVTSLEVTKEGKRSSLFEGTAAVDLFNTLVQEEASYNKLTFTNVDKNTTIYGGGNANTFVLDGGAKFEGNLIGGSGLRSADALSIDAITGLLGLQIPELMVVNTVDISDVEKKWGEASSWLTTAYLGSVASDVVTVTVEQEGDEGNAVQRLVLPAGADSGSFVLSYRDNVVTTLTPTAAIQISSDSAKTAQNIQTALNAVPGAPDVEVTGEGTDASPFVIRFLVSGAKAVELLTVSSVTARQQVVADLASSEDAAPAGLAAVQKIFLKNAQRGSLVLNLKSSVSAEVVPTGNIAVVASAAATATNIENAINDVLGAGKVTVVSLGAGVFQVTHTTDGAKPLAVVNATSTKLASDIDSAPVTYLPLYGAEAGSLKQDLYVAKEGLTGNYTLTVNGHAVTLAASANRTEIQTAIRASHADNSTIIVSDGTRVGAFVLKYSAGATGITAANTALLKQLLTVPVAKAETTTEGSDASSEKHTLSFVTPQAGDTFSLTYGAETFASIAWNDDPTELLKNIKSAFTTHYAANPANNIFSAANRTGSGTDFVLELDVATPGTLAITYTRGSGNTTGSASVAKLADAQAAVFEMQKVSHSGNSGTFTLSLGSKTTADIAWNATHTQVQDALNDANGTNANVTVTGTGTAADPWVITFVAAGDKDPLKLDSSKLKLEKTAAPVLAVVETASTAPQQEVQKIVSELKSGTFTLIYGGKKTTALAWNASNTDVQTALNAVMPAGTTVTVTGSNSAGYTVTYSGNKDYLTIEAFSPFDVTQKITGFSGKVQNISNLKYGPGINLLLGSNVGVDTLKNSWNTGNVNLNGLLGADTFEIGGGTTLADWLSDKVDIDPNSPLGRLIAFAKEKSDNSLLSFVAGQAQAVFGDAVAAQADYWTNGAVKDFLKAADLGGLLDLNWNPGIHILSGMTGGDTYKFSGFWGAAAVVEIPDVSVNGVALEVGYDTLDFSEVESDMRIDVYQLTTDNIGYFKSLFSETVRDAKGEAPKPDMFAVGMNFIIARENSLGAVLNSPIVALLGVPNIEETIGSVVVANDIENLVAGSGKTQIFMHNGATLQGVVSGEGELTFDYSDYLSTALKEQQQLTVGSGVTGTLKLRIDTGTVLTTADITIGSDTAVNATAIQTALNQTNILGTGAVTVIALAREPGTYQISFTAAGSFSQLIIAEQSLTKSGSPVIAQVSTIADGGTGITVNGYATANYELIPEVTIPVLGTLPSVNWDFASAPGVLGFRLGGLGALIGTVDPALGQLQRNFAVSNLSGIGGTPFNDKLIGNESDNTFDLSLYGIDTVDGIDGSDTVSFKDGEDGVTIDLWVPAVGVEKEGKKGQNEIQVLDLARATGGSFTLTINDPTYKNLLFPDKTKELETVGIDLVAGNPEQTAANIQAA
ncbi:MAG: hypothetical protein WCO67_09070 [Betaproteobacteria bacterium]